MIDRARQALVKLVLEPEWEAVFEPNTYGFRNGRGTHDAIGAIFAGISKRDKYVYDADISKFFDNINHKTLLNKLKTLPSIHRQIKAWLKAGVVMNGELLPTNEGSPQGGVISPLLALVYLHGFETAIRSCINPGRKAQQELTIAIYADDFVVLHKSLNVILKCKANAEQWLKEMSLEVEPSKTRISHTLEPYEGNVGFNFLGFNIRQYPVGKHHSGKNSQGELLGFTTLIKPSKEKIAQHVKELASIIDAHKTAPQEALISKLLYPIQGWCNYFSTVSSKSTFTKCDNILASQLRAWARYRTGKFDFKTLNKYWRYTEDRRTFSTNEGVKLVSHAKTQIKRHVKVKGDKSYFDGDVLYWSTRKGTHPEMPSRIAMLLKRSRGKCASCGLMFGDEDLIEVDHKIPKKDGGTDKFDNLQPLHRHCHDVKTARDQANSKVF